MGKILYMVFPLVWGYKIMMRIIWRILFLWASQKDDYVNVKTEWIIK